MTTTMVYHAAVRGIKLEEVESKLEGDIDLKGFLAISDKVRPGYEEIRVNFKVKTDIENVERLKALTRLSPVYDVVSKGTNVKVQIETK
ncbi:MAG: OsmC family protein [Syntrophobacterales bacterium]